MPLFWFQTKPVDPGVGRIQFWFDWPLGYHWMTTPSGAVDAPATSRTSPEDSAVRVVV
jgi:hypothetical protein